MISCPALHCVLLLAWLTWLGCTARPMAVEPPYRPAPNAPEMNLKAPEHFGVRLDTNKGVILLDIHRDSGRRGVNRFYNLVHPPPILNRLDSFGSSAESGPSSALTATPVCQMPRAGRANPDDPRRKSNVRSTVASAFSRFPTVERRSFLSISVTIRRLTMPSRLCPSAVSSMAWRLGTRSMPTTANRPAAESAAGQTAASFR